MSDYDLGEALIAVARVHTVVHGVDFVGGERFEEGSLRLEGWRVRVSLDKRETKLEASLQERVPSFRRGDPDYTIRRTLSGDAGAPFAEQIEGFLREFAVLPTTLPLEL